MVEHPAVNRRVAGSSPARGASVKALQRAGLSAQLAVLGGVIAPPLFVAATVGVTLVDKQFVADSEWSAVHRSEVGWPSVVIAALVICGLLVIGLASALWQLVPDARLVRVAAVALGVAGLAMCLVAFRQDPLGSEGAASWHDR